MMISIGQRRLGNLLGALCVAVPFYTAMAAQTGHTPPDWWIDMTNDRADAIHAELIHGADPNLESPQGQPGIMVAAASGSWKTFDVLLADPRTHVNIENALGETPLMYVAIAGDTARAQALIARGAKIDKLGWTPLHYAASKGQIAMIKLLLAHQAMPNAPSPDGVTPLMMAAYSGNRQAVQLLLNAGANPLVQDLKHHDAADWADQGKHGALAKELRALVARSEAAHQQAFAPPASPPPLQAPAPVPAAQAAPAADDTSHHVRGTSNVRFGD